MRLSVYIPIIAVLCICQIGHTAQPSITPNNIIFYCKPVDQFYAQQNENIQQEATPPYIEGVCAFYRGYTTFSNHIGKITLPRKHTQEDMYCVITRSIKPIFSHEESIQYLQITNAQETRMYYLKRVANTEQKMAHWNVSQMETQQGQSLPPNALVIFSRPEHVIMPTGQFDTITGGTLLLPNVYIRQSMPISANSLAFLRISQYFAPVKRAYAYNEQRYATGILP